MKNVDDLIESAADLAERGLSKGEIADELNVSRETASWLVERSGTAPKPAETNRAPQPGSADIHVDWSAIGRDSRRMGYVASAMADLLAKHGEDVVTGVYGLEDFEAAFEDDDTTIKTALEFSRI